MQTWLSSQSKSPTKTPRERSFPGCLKAIGRISLAPQRDRTNLAFTTAER